MFVTETADLSRAFTLLNTAQTVVVDTETDGLHPYHGNRIVGLALYFPEVDESFYIPFRHGEGFNWSLDVLSSINLSRTDVRYVYFNAKFDLHMLGVDSIADPPQMEDVMLAAQLLNENEALSNNFQRKGAFTLKRLAVKYLGKWAGEGEEQLKQAAKDRKLNPKSQMWMLPGELVAPYAEMDVRITWALREFYYPHLERWHLVDLYHRRSDFVLKVLLRMERNGVQVNTTTIGRHLQEIKPKIAALHTKIDAVAQSLGLQYNPINLNSPAQVKALLNMSGYNVQSTDKQTLINLQNSGFELAGDILQYRVLAKSDNTFYTPYLEAVDQYDLIHASYNPIGTETGRVSCNDPNLQQIPRKGKYFVKEVFEPREGYRWFQIDYKQLELRLATHFAKEKNMLAAFASGDPHAMTQEMLGVERVLAKNFNFGLLYNMGLKEAIRFFNKPRSFIEPLYNQWRALYSGFERANVSAERLAQQWRNPDGGTGQFQYVRLDNGRMRHYQEYAKYGEQAPFKDAWNFIVQGTGAAIAEESILRVCEAFPDTILPTMTTHDSLTVEVPQGRDAEYVPEMMHIMSDWPKYVPELLVDTEYTDTNWLEMSTWNTPADGLNK